MKLKPINVQGKKIGKLNTAIKNFELKPINIIVTSTTQQFTSQQQTKS